MVIVCYVAPGPSPPNSCSSNRVSGEELLNGYKVLGCARDFFHSLELIRQGRGDWVFLGENESIFAKWTTK